MTVIALLNVEKDPHVVADTLLSADGTDPRGNNTVWMPSVGQVSSVLGTADDPWYIVRLARKTFFLPNYGGVLAFSGDCSAAFDFWRELKAHILNLGAYQPDLCVDRQMVERALSHSTRSKRFHLLGLIRSAQGQWEVLTHNSHSVVDTKHFGTCYLAGSGAPMLERKIRYQDDLEHPIRPDVILRMAPTENLAEGLSADLLYAESGALSGMSNVSTYACGGFYEWYRVFDRGVKNSPARLDIHIAEVDGKPVVTRLYLVESLLQEEIQGAPIPAAMYSVMVINVIMGATEPIRHENGSWLLPAPDPYGLLLTSTFDLYDDPKSDGRLSGPVSAEILKKFFGKPAMVNRIRLLCSNNGLTTSRSISRLSWEQEVLATLSYENDQLRVDLGTTVGETAMQILQRLRPA